MSNNLLINVSVCHTVYTVHIHTIHCTLYTQWIDVNKTYNKNEYIYIYGVKGKDIDEVVVV